MAGLKEVPTDELLSFQDYPSVHTSSSSETIGAQLNIDITNQSMSSFDAFTNRGDGDNNDKPPDSNRDDIPNDMAPGKSFWTVEYYQKFFDVDTADVLDRIRFSMIPLGANLLKDKIKARPDLYGPFWIAVTLVFSIGVSGNIANYLQHATDKIHWKYDFHLVSYAATAIFLYITIVPLGLWALIKWSTNHTDLDGLDESVHMKPLELICLYGYSLFIYIPASILWTIQISFMQWFFVIASTVLSGSVLVYALMSSLVTSKYKYFLGVGIIAFHLFIGAGFMLFFFHDPHAATPEIPAETHVVTEALKTVVKEAVKMSNSSQ